MDAEVKVDNNWTKDSVGSRILLTPGPWQAARHKGEKQSFSTFGFPTGLISYSSFIGSRCATIWACVIFIEGDERTLKSDNIYCVRQIPYRHCDTALALFTKLLQIGGHPLLSVAGENRAILCHLHSILWKPSDIDICGGYFAWIHYFVSPNGSHN